MKVHTNKNRNVLFQIFGVLCLVVALVSVSYAWGRSRGISYANEWLIEHYDLHHDNRLVDSLDEILGKEDDGFLSLGNPFANNISWCDPGVRQCP